MNSHDGTISGIAARFVDSLAPVVESLQDAFFGVEYVKAARVPRGERLRLERHKNGRGRIAVHPLDLIEISCGGDHLAQLDDAIGWIYDRAFIMLARSLVVARNRSDLYAVDQAERMALWQEEHGFTDARLAAAAWLVESRAAGLLGKPFPGELDGATRLFEAIEEVRR